MQLIELFDASVSCQYVSTKINGALITNIMLIQKLKPRDITISAQLARKRSGISFFEGGGKRHFSSSRTIVKVRIIGGGCSGPSTRVHRHIRTYEVG